MDDDTIRQLLQRLARAHPSGGTVVERVAIVAEGKGSESILTWMRAHGAQAEAPVATTARHGIHDAGRGAAPSTVPARYILPVGALD